MAHPNIVTDSNSELGTSDFQSADAERETAPEAPESRKSELTLRDRIQGWVDAGRDYWTVPTWVRDAPPTLTELKDYAREGGWTRRLSGPIRGLGVLWLYVVAIPLTAKAYLKAHVMQRPGRFLAALLIWEIAIRSDPGIWVTAHVIRPYLHALAWIFLP